MTSREKPLVMDRHLEEARKIGERFPLFTEGYRCLLLKIRRKDAEGQTQRTVRTLVSRDSKNWVEILAMLLRERENLPEIEQMRIYQTVNARDIKKAVAHFVQHFVELLGSENRQPLHDAFFKCKAKATSAFMQRSSAVTKYFLFDCDTRNDWVLVTLESRLMDRTTILLKYATKNGWHFITEPFNPNDIELPEHVELKKDALMLLHFEQ